MKRYNECTYPEKLRRRMIGWSVMLALHIIYLIVLSELGGGDSRVQTNGMHAVMVIIGFGGIGWMGWKINHLRKLLKNPYLRKQNRLNEQDERNRWLHDKSGGDVWDIQFIGLLIVTLTASMFSPSAFHAVLPLLLLAVAVKIGSYVWYSRH